MNPETTLLRQINPGFVQSGRPSSQAFRPTPKDESRLSVEDASMIAPKAAWERFTGTLGFKSAGVMAVTYAECLSENLPVISDAVPYPEHCYIDFSSFTKSEVEKKSKVLASKAVLRGWLFTSSET